MEMSVNQFTRYTFNKLKVNFFFVSFRDFALATSALFANEHKEKLSAGNDEETRRSQFCACDLTAYSGTYFQVHKHERRLCHTLCWLVKGFFQKNSGNNWSDDFDYFMQKEDLNMHRDKKKTSDHAQVTWPINLIRVMSITAQQSTNILAHYLSEGSDNH